MKHYNVNGQVYAFEADGSQDAYIPAGAIPITDAEADALRTPPKPTQADIDAACPLALDAALDAGAQAWGYTNIVSASTYLNSAVPRFKAEAHLLCNWRDAAWNNAANEFDIGQHYGSVEEFLAAVLPPQPARP